MSGLLELQVVREDVDVLHVQWNGQNHLTEEVWVTYQNNNNILYMLTISPYNYHKVL